MSEITPQTVRALCCECGNLRTVSAKYSPPRDDNRATEFGDPRLWRWTGTVKCSVCKTRTRHAIIRDNCPEYRDAAEDADHQSIVLSLATWRLVHERRKLAEFSDEELLKIARRRVYELTDNVMKTVPLGDLTMEDCHTVLEAFKQIADNHGLS